MKSLAKVSLGASRELLLQYYVIWAKLGYACGVCGSAANSTLHLLDTIQNAALQIPLGAMQSSPVISLHEENGIPPLATQHCMTLPSLSRHHDSTANSPSDVSLHQLGCGSPVSDLARCLATPPCLDPTGVRQTPLASRLHYLNPPANTPPYPLGSSSPGDSLKKPT